MFRFSVARLAFACVALILTVAPSHGQRIAEPDRQAALSDAFAGLKAASAIEQAAAFEREIWTLWFIGPTETATARLQTATAALQSGAFDDAHQALDALLEDEPEFAEAWNQRAFVKFLKGDLYASLVDIEETLKREPRHFGALAGKARIENALGRPADASRTMGELGAFHPWMARISPIPADPPPPAPPEEL